MNFRPDRPVTDILTEQLAAWDHLYEPSQFLKRTLRSMEQDGVKYCKSYPMGRLEAVSLPGDLDYEAVAGLSREVVEKLTKVAPTTLGQAGRISGVTPAALTCLEIHLKKRSQRIEPLVPTRTLA